MRKPAVVIGLDDLRSARRRLDGEVGLVPTMGYLHEGHLSLVRRAREECKRVIVSVFVNPAQFSPTEDLAKYPRDLERDLALLEPVGVDLVWTPTASIMYPQGYQTWVEVEHLAGPLEGSMRPGHLRGVTTVVAKLFNAVQPDRAYFGQKDAQQAAVVRRMARDLDFPLKVIVCPTVREADGLAMSSRNKYLEAEDRRAAAALFSALSTAADLYLKGERNAQVLRQVMQDTLAAEPRVHMQYVSCADHETLEELEILQGRSLLSLAAVVGSTRLIDNIVLG